MKVSIKTKLRAGLLFLFCVILLIGILGGVFLYRISNESKMIIQDNYETVVYVKGMNEACDELSFNPSSEKALFDFDTNLEKQKKNVTEKGEQELTNELAQGFENLKSDPNEQQPGDIASIRKKLRDIEDLNLNAIKQKNDRANETAKSVILWMSLIGTIAVLLSFSFVVNFPDYIANPIRELTEGIKEIAARNYSKRLHFERNDEFGELAEAFNSMTGKLEEYESSSLAKLLFEKKRLDTVILGMRDAIIGVDEHAKILFLNPVALQLLGVKQGMLEGKLVSEAAASNDLLRELTKKPVTENESTSKPPLKIFADGRESYFNKEVMNVTAVPTGETEPRNIGYVIVLKNITQFREQDLAKTNFIATVSHELKTPVSSIKMSLKLLEDQRIGELNEEQSKLTGYIRDEANRLLNITGELLNMAQVETGKIILNIDTVPPTDIVDYAVRAIQAQADSKKIKIKISIPADIPSIHADAEKSAWVLTNILSNAIRYSNDDSQVDILLNAEGKNVKFSITDHGKGIPKGYQPRIFEKFFRAPGMKVEGTGLGLAIAKEFIESQNGSIGFSSEEGKGSSFWFLLPRS